MSIVGGIRQLLAILGASWCCNQSTLIYEYSFLLGLGTWDLGLGTWDLGLGGPTPFILFYQVHAEATIESLLDSYDGREAT